MLIQEICRSQQPNLCFSLSLVPFLCHNVNRSFVLDPDEVEEIKIVAIDKWNNKYEKTIKVTIDLQSTELARSFEDLKPNSVRVKTDKNKIAIIIGIEKYANLINLDAKYANRDAKAFRTYATQALGVKASNIKILVDDKFGMMRVIHNDDQFKTNTITS